MSRVIKKLTNPVIAIPKSIFDDTSLSPYHIGLLSILLSFPEDYIIDFEDLFKYVFDSPENVKNGINHLSDLGYITCPNNSIVIS